MTSAHHAVRRIRLAVISAAIASFALSVSAAEQRAPGLDDAATKAGDLTKKANDFGAKARDARKAPRAAPAPAAAALGSGIQCKCTQWSEVSNWIGNVCVRSSCRRNDPDDCRCLEYKKVPYEQSSCQAWTPNLCND